MGIIIFIDDYRYPVRRIGNLGNCIYNQSVIFFSVVRGYNIQAVTDFKQSGKIIFISSFAPLSDILPAKLVCKCFKLFTALDVKRRTDTYSCIVYVIFSESSKSRFITLIAWGDHDPFSIRATVRFLYPRSVSCSMKFLM